MDDNGFGAGLLIGFVVCLILASITNFCMRHDIVSSGYMRHNDKYYTVQEYGPVTNNPPEKEKE